MQQPLLNPIPSPIPTLNPSPTTPNISSPISSSPHTPTAQNLPPSTSKPPIKNVYRRQKRIPESILQSVTCQELPLDSVASVDEGKSLSPSSSAETVSPVTSPPSLDDFPIAIRKGVRACTKHPIQRFVAYNSLMPSFQAFTTVLDAQQIPRTIDEALKHPRWRQAVQEELDALEQNCTWTLTNLPPGKKAVGCKWILLE
ncbi:hypothetical protein GQ457_01G027990 [Hibiscus cannabinus]